MPDPTYLSLLPEMEETHVLKSGGYGTGDDPFANFTLIAEATGEARFHYPIQRIIEKCARALSLYKQERYEEMGEEFTDIAGLALCAEAMRRDDSLEQKISFDPQRVLNDAVDAEAGEDMCPNCVTPWKCNGPHGVPERLGVGLTD